MLPETVRVSTAVGQAERGNGKRRVGDAVQKAINGRENGEKEEKRDRRMRRERGKGRDEGEEKRRGGKGGGG